MKTFRRENDVRVLRVWRARTCVYYWKIFHYVMEKVDQREIFVAIRVESFQNSRLVYGLGANVQFASYQMR